VTFGKAYRLRLVENFQFSLAEMSVWRKAASGTVYKNTEKNKEMEQQQEKFTKNR